MSLDERLKEIEDVTEEELQETEVYILKLLEANANKQPPIYLSTLIRLYGGIKFRDSTIKRLTEENERLNGFIDDGYVICPNCGRVKLD